MRGGVRGVKVTDGQPKPVRQGRPQAPCPCCKAPGWWVGEASGERKTVYWCHTATCDVRSFVTN